MEKLPVLLLSALLLAGACVRAQEEPTNTTTTSTTSTTPSPDTTTTPDETTTTTPEPTTTTPDEPTTTSTPDETTTVPDTTPAPSPSPTPTPEVEKFFMVTEGNLTCIMLNADITAAVSYSKGSESAVASVAFPKDPEAGATATGTCSGSEGEQTLTVSWGATNASSSFTMVFNKTKPTEWSILKFTADLFMDPSVFINATDAGKTLHLTVPMSMIDIPVNHSYNCISKAAMSNVSATLDNKAYPLNVDVNMEKTQLEAFNEIKFEKDFLDNVHCDADKTSDIVPITVGCALAALVIIVLIAYLIGRRRRSAAYQSV